MRVKRLVCCELRSSLLCKTLSVGCFLFLIDKLYSLIRSSDFSILVFLPIERCGQGRACTLEVWRLLAADYIGVHDVGVVSSRPLFLLLIHPLDVLLEQSTFSYKASCMLLQLWDELVFHWQNSFERLIRSDSTRSYSLTLHLLPSETNLCLRSIILWSSLLFLLYFDFPGLCYLLFHPSCLLMLETSS